MALTQSAVVQAAVDILQQFGLADLSMRRLARELDVQVGALYWHVKNKQELLAQVAAQLLNSSQLDLDPDDYPEPRQALLQLCRRLYLTLLPIQDSAEVLEVASVLGTSELRPLNRMEELLQRGELAAQEAAFGRQLLLNHILGSVAHRQNLIQLEVAGEDQPDGFDWALERALTGLLPGSN